MTPKLVRKAFQYFIDKLIDCQKTIEAGDNLE